MNGNADISNVINASLLAQGVLAAPVNMNVCAIMTSQQTGPINSANRYQLYRDAATVAADFGSSSAMYKHALAFFGTQPNPINAGGVLVAGYWRGVAEDVAASAGYLIGGELVEATVVGELQKISDGSFDIAIDGAAATTLTAMDFRTVTSLADIATIIGTAIGAGATVAVNASNQIVITSATTGAASAVALATPDAVGTDVSTILELAANTGAVATAGAAAATLPVETQIDAANALIALVNVKGMEFIDQDTDANRQLMAAWAQANNVLVYETFSDLTTNLAVDVTNPVWAIKLASDTNYRMLFSKAGNRAMQASYMARMHTVNFAASNSALTMQLKTLAVTAEYYTETEIAAAKTVGLDIYTTIKDVPVVLCSGANDFTDNPYNLMSFVDAIQTNEFNLLKGTNTKVPQITRGVNQIVDEAEKTCRQYVRADVFGAGTWNSTDFFGDLDTFNRAIEQNGFYVLAGTLAAQSAADRAARKSPVIQIAVKNAGAIHSIDTIINFNL